MIDMSERLRHLIQLSNAGRVSLSLLVFGDADSDAQCHG
jgi:hypothetical protein